MIVDINILGKNKFIKWKSLQRAIAKSGICRDVNMALNFILIVKILSL